MIELYTNKRQNAQNRRSALQGKLFRLEDVPEVKASIPHISYPSKTEVVTFITIRLLVF